MKYFYHLAYQCAYIALIIIHMGILVAWYLVMRYLSPVEDHKYIAETNFTVADREMLEQACSYGVAFITVINYDS